MNKIENIIKGMDEDISDIHIFENKKLSFRRGGEIEFMDVMIYKKDIEEFLNSIARIDAVKDTFKQRDSDFSFEIDDSRFRGNVYRQKKSLSIAIRKIPYIRSIDELGLPEEIEYIFTLSSGVVFITGPTGSGKTTTLSAIVDEFNKKFKKHIITIEDPIEYIFNSDKSIITQREVSVDTPSYLDAIKSAMRQDPDIIVIGEVRDTETMRATLRAAETGHLCIATLHTTGSASTIERVIGMFSDGEKDRVRYELSIVLKAILSQKLIKSKDGRVAAVEFLRVDKSVSNMIKEDKLNLISNYIYTNKSKGLVSLDSQLVEMYRSNDISKEEMICEAIDKEYVDRMVSKSPLNIGKIR